MPDPEKLTLTCISTGGPATTVTWTRDSIIVTEGTHSVLTDTETAKYTHTLTVTTGGEYTCTVSNNKPSSDSATIAVQGLYPQSTVVLFYRDERGLGPLCLYIQKFLFALSLSVITINLQLKSKGCRDGIKKRQILTPLKIRVCFKPLVTLRQSLCRPRDCVHDLQHSGVVYEIKCGHCPKVYIGQTGRRLSQCLAEHKWAVKSADFNSSALAEHARSASHPIAWENTRILSNCTDLHSRLIEEAILIRNTSHTLNRDTGSLPSVYDNLIDARCRRTQA